ncbi:MAG: hypothetical protein KF723_22990 [Rhizobiaceae bacterium]|nr:hypothetical protein [Rhizobiaceae bacterium]
MAQDDDAAAAGSAEKWTGEARTPRDPGAGGAPAAGSAQAEATRREAIAADIAALAAQLGGEAEQLDLIAGSPDLEDLDTLAAAANKVASARRARGRPAGSQNRRNSAVFDYLDAMGHRHPAVTLSLIQTADTMELARALGTPMKDDDGHPYVDGEGRVIIQPADPLKVLAIQAKAAADLVPFDLAKKHHVEQQTRVLHLFMAGKLDAGALPGEARGLSIFGGENLNEINGDAVRIGEGDPHAEPEALQTKGSEPEAT